MPEGPEIRRAADEVEKRLSVFLFARYGLLFHLCNIMKKY